MGGIVKSRTLKSIVRKGGAVGVRTTPHHHHLPLGSGWCVVWPLLNFQGAGNLGDHMLDPNDVLEVLAGGRGILQLEQSRSRSLRFSDPIPP